VIEAVGVHAAEQGDVALAQEAAAGVQLGDAHAQRGERLDGGLGVGGLDDGYDQLDGAAVAQFIHDSPPVSRRCAGLKRLGRLLSRPCARVSVGVAEKWSIPPSSTPAF
jgi:hypothetical protein